MLNNLKIKMDSLVLQNSINFIKVLYLHIMP
nr:MAG TPA: hypothetical protein [Bacteriophage sp.]